MVQLAIKLTRHNGGSALSKGDPLPNDKHAGKGKKADEESTYRNW